MRIRVAEVFRGLGGDALLVVGDVVEVGTLLVVAVAVMVIVVVMVAVHGVVVGGVPVPQRRRGRRQDDGRRLEVDLHAAPLQRGVARAAVAAVVAARRRAALLRGGLRGLAVARRLGQRVLPEVNVVPPSPAPSMRCLRRVVELVTGLGRRVAVPVFTATVARVRLLSVAVAGILLLVVAEERIAVVVQPLVGPLRPVVLSGPWVLVAAEAVLAVARAVVVVTLVQILLRPAQRLSRQVAVLRRADVLPAVPPVQPLLGGPAVGGRAVPLRPRVPLPPLLLPLEVSVASLAI